MKKITSIIHNSQEYAALKGDTGNTGPVGPQGATSVYDSTTQNFLTTLETTIGQDQTKTMTQKAIFDELNYEVKRIPLLPGSAVVTNKYDNGGSSWQNGTSTKYGYVLPVTPGAWYKWGVGASSTCMVWLKTSALTTGDNSANYAGGMTTVAWWSNDPTAASYHLPFCQAPSDANFVYFRMKNGSTDYSPSFWGKVEFIKDEIAEIKDKASQGIDGVYAVTNHKNDVLPSDGYIATSGTNANKWVTSTSYKGKVMPFAKYAGRRVSIRLNGSVCRYAFLTKAPSYSTNASTVNYCAGETGLMEHEYEGMVPYDCKYLYVYADSAGVDVTPDVITHDAVLDAHLENAFVEEEDVDISQLTAQDCSIGTDFFYLDSSNPVQKHIALPVTPNDVLQITSLGVAEAQYVFATASYNPPYTNSQSIPVSKGMLARRVLNPQTSYIERVPADAAYLLMTKIAGDGSTANYDVKKGQMTNKVKSLTPNAKVRIMQWNIGHFAMGAANDTTLTSETYAQKLPSYKQMIHEADADIVCVCEYNREMLKPGGGQPDILAKDTIFSNYPYPMEAWRASQSPYMWTAIMSRLKAKSWENDVFANSMTVQKGRYMQIATIEIGGREVKVVATHLDWGSSSIPYSSQYEDTNDAKRLAQIQYIIDKFANDKYVIVCADYNIAGTVEYDDFTAAGYQMANHGYLGDLPTVEDGAADRHGDGRCLDNIIVKGFSIGATKVYDQELELSDHMPIA